MNHLADTNLPLDARVATSNLALMYANAVIEFHRCKAIDLVEASDETYKAYEVASDNMHSLRCAVDAACASLVAHFPG
jgi:hypothetical protein